MCIDDGMVNGFRFFKLQSGMIREYPITAIKYIELPRDRESIIVANQGKTNPPQGGSGVPENNANR